jgi:hypothetical protein
VNDNQATGIASSVAAANLPWAFTQNHPLNTREFVDEAKKRGFNLDLSVLRELYRHGLLIPFVYVSARQVGDIPKPVPNEPSSHGTSLIELRYARDRGRLADLALQPFKPRLRFEWKDADRRWWNGLIYSRYQLLALCEARAVLEHRTLSRHGRRLMATLPAPDAFSVERSARLRRIAIAATALEARYLPKLDPEWLRLVNTDADRWRAYQAAFEAADMSRCLEYSAAEAREDAEWLLLRAHDHDPLTGDWGQLVRRSPPSAWKMLKGAALVALDHRLAAELLLLFCEELAEHREAEPLPDLPDFSWHPLRERLSYRRETLDQNLMGLGISPHPRVVLAVEGETEQAHMPLVWRTLGYSDAPELMRLLKLGTVDQKLQKIAALAAAPLVAGRTPGNDSWELIKPPTCLLVAVDPEGRQFGDPDKVERTRRNIINEIHDVLLAQGVDNADPADIEDLVRIRTWSARCYEFAHFTDQELADCIMTVHQTVNGLTRDELVAAIAEVRARGKDIKAVWSRWDYQPSKVELASALWPVLERKIKVRIADPNAPTPEIAEVAYEAYTTAQQWRHHSFVLAAIKENDDKHVGVRNPAPC